MQKNERLWLQFLADHASPAYTYPEMLDGMPERCTELGWCTTSVDRNFVIYELTAAGREALAGENKAIGNMATRLVHEVKYFGHLKPVVYGYPHEWPIDYPVRRIDGDLVADRRTFLQRLFAA